MISATDKRGGAGIAAYRLCRALRNTGVDAQMIVQEKSSNDDWVILHKTLFGKFGVFVRKVLDRLPWWLLHHDKDELLFSTSWIPSGILVKKINDLKPDIVHLHWVQGGMLRVEDIVKIKAQIVWTMHDVWLFTGGSHYCADCSSLEMNKTLISKWNLKRKQKTFSMTNNMIVIGPSNWITKKAKGSIVFSGKNIVHIPNFINTNVFNIVSEREKIREFFDLPKYKKLILFGAVNSTNDKNKGFDLLQKALDKLQLDNVELVVFGARNGDSVCGYKTHYVGNIKSEEKMVELYNCADVMVVPSRQENLSNVIMESLSCGTPVVAFDVGGNSDMAVHKQNGYLARPFDPDDLARGIEWVLENNKNGELGKNAREKIIQNFSEEVVIPKYIDLYKSILSNQK